jgi:hypothetical protein
MRMSIPSPFGHSVTGFDERFQPIIETMSEETARNTIGVEHIRRRMPNGKFIYRTITSR